MKKILMLLLMAVVQSLPAKDLKEIIAEGDLSSLEKFVAKGGDINELIEIEFQYNGTGDWVYDEMHPLSYAAAKNQIELVYFFIQHKQTIEDAGFWKNAINQGFVSSLATKNEELIKLLYSFEPDVNARCLSCRDHNAIMVAAGYGLEDWYFKLKPKSDLNLLNVNGSNLLHVASAGGSIKIVEDVLSTNLFELNLANETYSQTPLDLALWNNHQEVFYLLVKSGAEISQSTAIWYAAAQGNNTALYNYVCEHASLEHIFYTDVYGNMALHAAMSQNNTSVAIDLMNKILTYLGNNSTIRFQNKEHFLSNKYHALMYPITEKNKEIYEAFVKFGVAMNQIYEDDYYVPFYNYLSTRAKKQFGKDFVENIYAKYSVIEVE